MPPLFDNESSIAQELRAIPVSANTGGLIQARNASLFGAHMFVHDWWSQEQRFDSNTKHLWGYGNGSSNGVIAVTHVNNIATPSCVFNVVVGTGAGGITTALQVTCSPAMPTRGRRVTVMVRVTGDASSTTYNARIYLDGRLWGSAVSPARTNSPTTPNLFNFTTDGFAVGGGSTRNCRGVHAHWLLSGTYSDAQCDAIAAIPFCGAPLNHRAQIVYSPGTVTVEGTTGGPGVRPEVPITSANLVTIDVNAASFPTTLLAARGAGTITGTVRWVDPFEESGLPAPPPELTLSGAPAGWAVSAPVMRKSPRLSRLARIEATGQVTEEMVVGCVANSRTSYNIAARFALAGGMGISGRQFPGNYVDHCWFTAFYRTTRGRDNYQPPLNTTNGGAWGFDCQDAAPLTTGSAPVDLSTTTVSRFGTGTRVPDAEAGAPTWSGPGDPILVPASSSYRLLACAEDGLRTSDAITVHFDLVNFPNSAQPTVHPEAAEHGQAGADVLSAAAVTGLPTFGTAMAGVAFTGYSSSTNVFSGVASTTGLQVGDIVEVCASDGSSLADIELSVVSAIGAGTITIDGKLKAGAAIAATPANYTLKWCAPLIHRVSVSHPGNVTNANWRGLKVTAGASGRGVIIMSAGVTNVTRPGLRIVPLGWSGRGWVYQYLAMSHVVSARDGKTMAQRRFELLDIDLLMFSVADQGNFPVASYPDFIKTYVDYILRGCPNAEIVMAGEPNHSASETVTGLTSAASSYNNHFAAMAEVARERGYTFLCLAGDTSEALSLPGNVWAQYMRGILLDGTAHQFDVWEAWMDQVRRLESQQLEATLSRSIPGSIGLGL